MNRSGSLSADAACGESRATVIKKVEPVMIYLFKGYSPQLDLSKQRGTSLHQLHHTTFNYEGGVIHD